MTVTALALAFPFVASQAAPQALRESAVRVTTGKEAYRACSG
ncbi:hypothetical protein [Streptomyces buecherae]|nr:hypothetical protein [Streptomyces buecherae]